MPEKWPIYQASGYGEVFMHDHETRLRWFPNYETLRAYGYTGAEKKIVPISWFYDKRIVESITDSKTGKTYPAEQTPHYWDYRKPAPPPPPPEPTPPKHPIYQAKGYGEVFMLDGSGRLRWFPNYQTVLAYGYKAGDQIYVDISWFWDKPMVESLEDATKPGTYYPPEETPHYEDYRKAPPPPPPHALPPSAFTCPYCGVTFSSRGQLDTHIASKHPVSLYPAKNTWFMYYLSDNSIKARTAPVTRTGGEIDIPKAAAWTDRGVVLSAGGSGSWDVRLTGALSPCTVVKRNEIYFLYYIGADGNRKSDGGPRHRALGVATSSDGLHFTKYDGNPILTYLPHNNEEEGIFSAGAFLDVNGEVIMYYSALDAGSAISVLVDSDVRLAVSGNGLSFSDKGDVISHADSRVWGYGDELFPLGAFREGNTWYVYYTAVGHGVSWDLGLAWGPSRSNIASHTKKVSGLSPDHAKGGCDPMRLSTDKIVLFTEEQVRIASVHSPGALSPPAETYTSPNNPAVYLDATPLPPETFTAKTITHDCGAKISYQVSSIAAQNVALTCPYDGLSLGVKGVKETVIITNLDAMAAKIQGEIAILDNRIAELEAKIEAFRAERDRAKEVLGV